jgi:hypothetical protein
MGGAHRSGTIAASAGAHVATAQTHFRLLPFQAGFRSDP